MTTKSTGGPAFPATQVDGGCDGIGLKDGVWHFPGMTLRDYFAAKAMQGFAASESEASGHWIDETAAERAYAWADAMLKARGQ